MATVTVTNTGRDLLCPPHLLRQGETREVNEVFARRYPLRQLRYRYPEEALIRHAEDGRLRVDWHSPLSGIEGYGRHAIWLVRALQRAGVDLVVHDCGLVRAEYLPADIAALRRSHSGAMPSRIGLSFTLGYDPMLHDHASMVRIGITQFETDRLPRAHVSNVNLLDHVIVTSSFQVQVFRRSGVTAPISVMRPGIETDDFPYVERRKDGTFKVLMMGALTKRKDPLAAIRIFQAASDGNPDWRFTIKTRACDGLDEVRRVIAIDRRIRLVVQDDDPSLVAEWYAEHDCFLWPSKGEGVGLPPLEAMATGMEVICADNSGMSDYVDSRYCWPVRTAGTEPAAGPGLFTQRYVDQFGDVGHWWVPSEGHATRQLRRCFNAWRAGRGKGEVAARAVRERFTIDHSAADVVRVLEQYA